jgi:hypothetical protein
MDFAPHRQLAEPRPLGRRKLLEFLRKPRDLLSDTRGPETTRLEGTSISRWYAVTSTIGIARLSARSMESS